VAQNPSWTWRLWGESSCHQIVRLFFRFLQWSADSHSIPQRIISFISLGYGIWAVANFIIHVFNPPILLVGLCAGAIFLAAKGLVANIAALAFGEGKTAGGIPLIFRFDVVVPRRAEKVAIIGQTLAAALKSNYKDTLSSLKTILSRRNTNNEFSVKDVILVLQSPKALFHVQPSAFEDLRKIALPGIIRLCRDLKKERERVKIACHPASTLSMIAVDWHRNKPLAIVSPKLQMLSKISDRLSLIIRGEQYKAVAADIERFIFEAENRKLPGAFCCSLAEAGTTLERALSEVTTLKRR
jgi:hypothetical protein